ncbi:MAG: D-amino acid dehydrogenase [Parvularculales bacterium]
MRILILGAGLMGVTSAFTLAREGHEVTVLERCEGVGLETSFANGGQLCPSETMPWLGPHTPGLIMGWVGRKDAPFRLRLSADVNQWRWLAASALNCTYKAQRAGMARNFSLACYSRDELGKLESLAQKEGRSLAYDAAHRGVLRIFHDETAYNHACEEATALIALGENLAFHDSDGCVAIEPSLQAVKGDIVGGIYAPDDQTADAHLFTRALAEWADDEGVQFTFNISVGKMEYKAGEWRVYCGEDVFTGDAVVVCAGVFSPSVMRGFGRWLPVWPLKGYSVTVPVKENMDAPQVGITDESRRLVVSRLGNRLRAAGLAELTKRPDKDKGFDEARARVVLRGLRALFPRCDVAEQDVRFWHGYRPMTPDSSPLIGPVPGVPMMFINTGHGSLGWTLAMGSAALLRSHIQETAPVIDPAGYGPARFSWRG